MEERSRTMTRENELARLIFLANDLTAVRRLRRYLTRHPDLWLSLSPSLRESVESVILDTFLAECVINGAPGFSFT